MPHVRWIFIWAPLHKRESARRLSEPCHFCRVRTPPCYNFACHLCSSLRAHAHTRANRSTSQRRQEPRKAGSDAQLADGVVTAAIRDRIAFIGSRKKLYRRVAQGGFWEALGDSEEVFLAGARSTKCDLPTTQEPLTKGKLALVYRQGTGEVLWVYGRSDHRSFVAGASGRSPYRRACVLRTERHPPWLERLLPELFLRVRRAHGNIGLSERRIRSSPSSAGLDRTPARRSPSSPSCALPTQRWLSGSVAIRVRTIPAEIPRVP